MYFYLKSSLLFTVLLSPNENIFVIFRTKSNIAVEGESIIDNSEVENGILDQTDYAESDEVNHSIVVENTDSPLDESHKADSGPKELYFKKPYKVRGGKDKIIQEIKKGREERLAMMKEMKEAECNNPIQIFFKSMASTVITFPPELVVETRMRVNNIVSEMELRALTAKNNTPTITNNHATTTPSTFTNITDIMDDSSTSNSATSNTSVPDYSSPSSTPENSNFSYLDYIADF